MRYAITPTMILACAFQASAADTAAGVIKVSATYPGADARMVDEAVIGPLFQQISGVEGMTRIESEARNDGTGTLTVFFEPRADLNLAEVRIHNRVALAMPAIPEPCKRLGIPVRKLPLGPPRFLLAITSSDPKHDLRELKSFASILLKPELSRIPGVSDVRVLGVEDFGLQVILKPDRLRAYNVMATDVIEALRRENVQAPAGGVIRNKTSEYNVTAPGRLTKPEEFASIMLRANPKGDILRLRDVGRVELTAPIGGLSQIDGKPAALIAVTAWPGRVSPEQLMKTDAARDLPPGMTIDLVADRETQRLVTVELRLPEGSAIERTQDAAARAAELIQALPGKPRTIAFAEQRVPNAATIHVTMAAEKGPTAAEVEKALDGLTGATAVRVGEAPPGEEAFPVRIALTDHGEFRQPVERGEDLFRKSAEALLTKLATDRDITALAASPLSLAPQLIVDIDRDRCAEKGVELRDVFTTLQVSLGGVHATDFQMFGRTYKVTVHAEGQSSRNIEDLEHAWVGNAQGEMVPLSALIKFREASGPTAVVRVNGYRAIIVTAAPATGKTPAEATERCLKLARETLPWQYLGQSLTGTPSKGKQR